MLIRFKSISIFNIFEAIGIYAIAIIFSCEDADYDLDNPFDPNNMGLTPPALFFHPSEINTTVNESISVQIYGYKLDPSAAAHFDIRYDWGSLEFQNVVPGPFFEGMNSPIEITVVDKGVIDLFMYYIPDTISNQNTGGTLSIATIYFNTTNQRGESGLLFGPNTTIRDAANNTLLINDLGEGYINVE